MPCIDAITPSLPKRGMSARAEVLRVLDAPAQVLLSGIRLERALEDVERLAVGAVADRVHAQLITVLDGQPRRLLDVSRSSSSAALSTPACRCTARAATRRADRARHRSPS